MRGRCGYLGTGTRHDDYDDDDAKLGVVVSEAAATAPRATVDLGRLDKRKKARISMKPDDAIWSIRGVHRRNARRRQPCVRTEHARRVTDKAA
jgi:hypothetical protein